MNEITKKLMDLHSNSVENIRDTAAKLISPEGEALPGVSVEQVLELLEKAENLDKARKKCAEAKRKLIETLGFSKDEIEKSKVSTKVNLKKCGFDFGPTIKTLCDS